MDENTSLQSSTPPKALTKKKEKEKPPEAEVAVATQNPMKTLRTMLEDPGMMQQIANVLPQHITPERMIRVALTAVQRNPKLLDCDKRSICGCVVEASELGLEPNGTLGHCSLVPFMNNKVKPARMEAQLMIEYKGMMELAQRSPKVAYFYPPEVVYLRDDYTVVKGLNPDLIHKPYDGGDDPGEIVAAYAVAKIEGQKEKVFKALSVREIEEFRAHSKASKKGPWVDHYAAMCKKTAVRQLCKFLPCSVEDQRTLRQDELREYEISEGDDVLDIHAEPVTGLEELADDLESGDQSDLPVGGK